MTKIISPIKSVEGAERVSAAGADELYVGVRMQGLKFMSYSGRKASCCLDNYDQLAEACERAHAHGTEVNLTANLPFMTDLLTGAVKRYIKHSVEAGVDALIIADMGTVLLVRDMGIDLPIYASSYFVARNIWLVLSRSVPPGVLTPYRSRIAAFHVGRVFRALRHLREPAARATLRGTVAGLALALAKRDRPTESTIENIRHLRQLLWTSSPASMPGT